MNHEENNDYIIFNLQQILKDIRKNLILIILIALLSGSACFAGTFFLIKPKYEAVAALYVNNSSFSFGSTSFSISSSEISASSSLAETYLYILNSRTTLESIIERTGVNYTYEELRKKVISSKVVAGTAMFEVTVTSTDPAEAEMIANTVADILPERISEIVDGSSVRIVDYAIIPAHRASPSYTMSVIIGGLIGGVISAVWVVISSIVRETEDSVLKNADEITKNFPRLQVLAVIPDIRMSNKKGYYYYSSYYGKKRKGAAERESK